MSTYTVTMMIPTQVTVRAATPSMAKLYARNAVDIKKPIIITDPNNRPHLLVPNVVCIERTDVAKEPSDGPTAA